MTSPTTPAPTGDDSGVLAADVDDVLKPDVPEPGHPTVFIEDGPTLAEPAAQ